MRPFSEYKLVDRSRTPFVRGEIFVKCRVTCFPLKHVDVEKVFLSHEVPELKLDGQYVV